jgi:hypothetical protein
VARLIARSGLTATGVLSPEQLVSGHLFDLLVSELANLGLEFHLTVEESARLVTAAP